MADEVKENGDKRNPDGTFAVGTSGGPGRPKEVSITSAIKRKLEEYNWDGKDATKRKKTLDIVVETILHNAIEKKDQKTLKDIWAYIDGMPKAQVDLGVDKESLQELTNYLRNISDDSSDDSSGQESV